MKCHTTCQDKKDDERLVKAEEQLMETKEQLVDTKKRIKKTEEGFQVIQKRLVF